ncbi:MAG: hypothetical protein LQ348_001125 [Seirophora lacunosa]|nr:MAG: hypothetical protein LQ348_001125 [Seirophora lacunosa]
MRSFTIFAALATFFLAIMAQDVQGGSNSTLSVSNSTQGVSNYSPGDPLVNIVNTSPTKTHVYKLEGNADNPPSAYGAGSGFLPMVTVLPGQTVHFQLGKGFIGAITALSGAGTRFEVNFRGDSPGDYKTWYNSDMEFGMSDTTMGPANGDKQINGLDSLAGEQDCLAKANSAWASLDEAAQQQLLDTGYLEGSIGTNGALTAVHMDKQAGDSVVEFFQNIAEMNAYVNPGSVLGKPTSRTAAAANLFSWSVETKELTITGY